MPTAAIPQPIAPTRSTIVARIADVTWDDELDPLGTRRARTVTTGRRQGRRSRGGRRPGGQPRHRRDRVQARRPLSSRHERHPDLRGPPGPMSEGVARRASPSSMRRGTSRGDHDAWPAVSTTMSMSAATSSAAGRTVRRRFPPQPAGASGRSRTATVRVAPKACAAHTGNGEVGTPSTRMRPPHRTGKRRLARPATPGQQPRRHRCAAGSPGATAGRSPLRRTGLQVRPAPCSRSARATRLVVAGEAQPMSQQAHDRRSGRPPCPPPTRHRSAHRRVLTTTRGWMPSSVSARSSDVRRCSIPPEGGAHSVRSEKSAVSGTALPVVADVHLRCRRGT